MERLCRHLILGLALLVLAVAGPAVTGFAATASGPRLGLHGDGVTRFVVDLSDQAAFAVSSRADPYRVIIDMPGLEWGGGSVKPWGSVNAMRVEEGRIVLDLRRPALVKNAFTIAPRDGMGWRLVVDLSESTHAAFMAKAEASAPVLKPPPGVKAAAPPQTPPKPAAKPAAPPPAAAKAAPPVEEAASIPNIPAQPSQRIVLTSPNAQLPSEPLPEPVTAPSVAEAPQPVAPVSAPAPAPAPVPSKSAATTSAEKAGKGPPILSAPMPPPPEKPQPPAPVATPSPPPPSPVQAVAVPAPQPAKSGSGTASNTKSKDGVPVIVIDPGHGGVDPGATGVSGIYEKHITLAMAREMKAILEKGGRYKVVLTRDRDVFIRLRERVAFARAQGADLFISLHADAVANPQIRGLSVYTLSQNASDAEAQALAEKENKADLIAGIDLTHESPDVAGILIDLAQRETMNRSAVFATELVDEVGQEMDLLGNTHRFAGFAVLKAPDVPAVLVEMGYLSNDYEEKQLRQPQYRARLAKALAAAVERYFPPSLKAKRP